MTKYYQAPRQAAEDVVLIERIKLHDSKSLAVLYAKYHRKIHAIVLRIVKREDDANEIVQDVFLQVWQKATYFDSFRGPFLNWLITVAHNSALNFVRSARVKRIALEDEYGYRQFSDLLTEATIDSTTALDRSIDIETSNLILLGLDRLPPEQREVLVRAYYNGQSHREISEALQVPLGTIKTRMRLGMLKLKVYLKTGSHSQVLAAH